MAKRTHNLGGRAAPPPQKLGYEAQIYGSTSVPEAEAEAEEEYKRKTYLLTQEMIDRIAALSRDKGVRLNDLVRVLLAHALDEVERGHLEVTPGVTTVRRVE